MLGKHAAEAKLPISSSRGPDRQTSIHIDKSQAAYSDKVVETILNAN